MMGGTTNKSGASTAALWLLIEIMTSTCLPGGDCESESAGRIEGNLHSYKVCEADSLITVYCDLTELKSFVFTSF